jgi:hypothetical protein
MTGNSAALQTIMQAQRGIAVVFNQPAAVAISTSCPGVSKSIAFSLVDGKTSSVPADAKPGSVHIDQQIHQHSAAKFHAPHRPGLSV